MSSRYERQRALNVVRNQGVLRDLGLGLHGMEPTTTATKPRTASSGKKKMANAVAAAAAPLRRSRRGQQLEPELKGVRDVAIDAPRNASMESARHAPDTGAHKPKRRKMEGATDPVVRRKVRTPKTSVIRPVAPQSPSQTEVHPSPNPHPKNENPPPPLAGGPFPREKKKNHGLGTGVVLSPEPLPSDGLVRLPCPKVGTTVAMAPASSAPLGGGGCSCSCSDGKGCEQMAGLDPDTVGDRLLSGYGANGLGWHGTAPSREVATGMLVFADAPVRFWVVVWAGGLRRRPCALPAQTHARTLRTAGHAPHCS